LDRVPASVEWEQKFPLVSVWDLTHSGADHTPLLIDVGRQAHVGNKARFSFELSWLEQEVFHEMNAAEWADGPIGKSPIQTWQKNIRRTLASFLTRLG
jgi:hypothetical protein